MQAITSVRRLHLDPSSLIAQGSSRWIYQHPDDSRSLIKVLKKGLIYDKPKNMKQKLQVLKGRYKLARHLRELREYIGVVSNPNDEFAAHLPAMTGLQVTDQGFGIVVQAVRGVDGGLAPTLRRVFKNAQLNSEVASQLGIFFERLQRSSVVIGDLNPTNIVYGCVADEPAQFYLVDGMGDSTFVPVRSFFPAWNANRKIKKIAALRARFLKKPGAE